MDYKDYAGGATKDFFWFKAKNGLIKVLLDKLELGEKPRILNVGAGMGDDVPLLSRYGTVSVIDTDQNALALIPGKLVAEKMLCDACSLQYPDSSFDVAVAFDVLEHIEQDTRAVDEIYRVLKPGGFFIFTVPAFNFLFSAHDRNLEHFRRYDRKAIKKLLHRFTLVQAGYWMCALFVPVALQRLATRGQANPHPQFIKLPAWINRVFYAILMAENFLVKHTMPLPVGLTIQGIYRK